MAWSVCPSLFPTPSHGKGRCEARQPSRLSWPLCRDPRPDTHNFKEKRFVLAMVSAHVRLFRVETARQKGLAEEKRLNPPPPGRSAKGGAGLRTPFPPRSPLLLPALLPGVGRPAGWERRAGTPRSSSRGRRAPEDAGGRRIRKRERGDGAACPRPRAASLSTCRERGWGLAQVLEHLPGQHEALSAVRSNLRKTNKSREVTSDSGSDSLSNGNHQENK